MIQSGDIDNRVKTLIDALRIPCSNALGSARSSTPRQDENPFFCLIEDDKLITKFSIETDWLLDPLIDDGADILTTRVIMKVTIRPEIMTTVNANFS